jgi:WD40 repeat protein
VFSPDGKRIVTASSDKTARVWDAGTGRVLATFDGYTVAFSPDGKRVATTSNDTTRLWDAKSGNLLSTLTGFTAAFSPDGKRIVTASDDNTARVYIVDPDDLLKWAEQQAIPAEAP